MKLNKTILAFSWSFNIVILIDPISVTVWDDFDANIWVLVFIWDIHLTLSSRKGPLYGTDQIKYWWIIRQIWYYKCKIDKIHLSDLPWILTIFSWARRGQVVLQIHLFQLIFCKLSGGDGQTISVCLIPCQLNLKMGENAHSILKMNA